MAAARSFRVELKNKTDLALRRSDMALLHGIWANNNRDTPPENLSPMTKAAWENESDGFATGAEGNVTFQTDAGVVFVSWNNPFVGSNGFGVQVPAGYEYDHGDISGDNASVILTISVRL